jgi:hypothetical protein
MKNHKDKRRQEDKIEEVWFEKVFLTFDHIGKKS